MSLSLCLFQTSVVDLVSSIYPDLSSEFLHSLNDLLAEVINASEKLSRFKSCVEHSKKLFGRSMKSTPFCNRVYHDIMLFLIEENYSNQDIADLLNRVSPIPFTKSTIANRKKNNAKKLKQLDIDNKRQPEPLIFRPAILQLLDSGGTLRSHAISDCNVELLNRVDRTEPENLIEFFSDLNNIICSDYLILCLKRPNDLTNF